MTLAGAVEDIIEVADFYVPEEKYRILVRARTGPAAMADGCLILGTSA